LTRAKVNGAGKESSSNEKIANEVSTKWVQTNETAFVPCESCAKIQTNLKQNADHLINMCHYQNINSQVGKYRASLMASQLVGGWLSGDDLDKWLIEQDKDLARIAKQLEFLSKNNDLLKTKLSDNEAAMAKLSSSEKELKKTIKEEQETKMVTVKQYEKKLTDQKTELNAKIAGLEAELANLSRLKNNLEQKFDALKNLNESNEKIIIELS
jgi:chromosome segregation ATPase